MKNRIAAFVLAAALVGPTGALWASAGDASTQGEAGTTTGTPQVKSTVKKHHGHHHHKKSKASETSNPSGAK